MIIVWISSIATVTVLIILKYGLPSRRLWNMGNALPGPKAFPLIGNCFLFLKFDNLIATLDEIMDKYGPVVRLWLGKKLWIYLTNPDDIKVFLSDKKHYMKKADMYRMLDDWLGNGLVISDGVVWQSRRKFLTPTFHFNILEQSIGTIIANATVLIENLSALPPNTEIDVRDYIEKCSLDLIGEIAMGYKFNVQKSNDVSYLNAIKDLTAQTINRVKRPWLMFDVIFRLTNSGKKYYHAVTITKNMVQKLITEKKEALNNRPDEVDNQQIVVTTDFKEEKNKSFTFLELLLTSGNFNDQEIMDEVQTFLFGGHDTTTVCLTFCLYLLARHQDIQDKAAAEARYVIGENENPSISTFADMKYIENILKETMRIYTPVPIIARKVEKDTSLPSGYVIPAGSLVHFNLIRMHNRQDLFSNPNTFDPDRFEKSNTRHPYSYIPFSAGARNCIGQKLAMMEMKAVLAFLLRSYKFTPASDIKAIDALLVLTSYEHVIVKIDKRE